MITFEEILSLGWQERWPETKKDRPWTFFIQEEHGRHIMAFLQPDEEGFHTCSIKWVDEDVNVNEWENSDPAFHGVVKVKEDLHYVMRLIGAIEY